MEKQIFKLNNKDEEFVPIEVSDEMKDFFRNVRGTSSVFRDRRLQNILY